MQNISSSAAFADSKPHYELLDGLRGIAALLVIWYHIFEGFATSPIDQRFNHGYLAVDFFFILSGFVVGYAYDDRWKTTMNTKDFFKRRLIRLHPMVILGAVLGAITFCIQGCEKWDGTQVSISMVMLALLLNLFLIPAVPGSGSEVRGNGEMYPLNGPSWSLFFEYIGNILYALFIRRFSTKQLTVLVILAAIGLQLRSLHSQVQDAQAQRDALTAQVQAQEQENAALAADIAEGATEDKMKEIAQEELGPVQIARNGHGSDGDAWPGDFFFAGLDHIFHGRGQHVEIGAWAAAERTAADGKQSGQRQQGQQQRGGALFHITSFFL